MNFFIGDLKPQVHPNICQGKKVLTCTWLLKNKSWQKNIIFEKNKLFFTQNCMYEEKNDMPLKQSIIIRDLTYKCVWFFEKSSWQSFFC